MRTILIVQFLIIIAGAYYLYTLSATQTADVPEEAVIVEVLPAPTTTPAANTVATTTTDTPAVRVDHNGPDDVGMEWPTLEGSGQLESN
jgi:hypothetical protein